MHCDSILSEKKRSILQEAVSRGLTMLKICRVFLDDGYCETAAEESRLKIKWKIIGAWHLQVSSKSLLPAALIVCGLQVRWTVQQMEETFNRKTTIKTSGSKAEIFEYEEPVSH